MRCNVRAGASEMGVRVGFVVGAIVLGVCAVASHAAVYADGTDLNQAVARAQAYIACNGGPAVAVEIYLSDGTLYNWHSGALLTSPDGKNRTVVTCAHAWVPALQADPNAYARVITGTNVFTDRGMDLLVSQVLVAPGYDQWSTSADLTVMRLPVDVPNTGRFVIGSANLAAVVTTTGVGYRLTQQQLRDGTYAEPDGNHARFDGRVNPGAFGNVSDYFYNTSVFQVGQYPFGGVSAGGNSGSGTFLDSSFQFDPSGRITYGTYIGTSNGWGGDRLGVISGSVYIDASVPEVNSFLTSALNAPEPGSAMLLLAAAGLLMRRTSRAA